MDLEKVAKEIGVQVEHVKNVINLLNDDNTVPFIARYRKEVTGGMDETNLFLIEKKYKYLSNLEDRKQAILQKIKAQGQLTSELEAQIKAADKLVTLEDLYLPFKSKRKTLASRAIEQGLLPLAEEVLAGKVRDDAALKQKAKKFVDKENELPNATAVLTGVKNIITERVVLKLEVRDHIRDVYTRHGTLSSSKAPAKSEKKEKSTKKKQEEKREKSEATSNYSSYLDFHSKIGRLLPHQILALNRGEDQGVLKLAIEIEDSDMVDKILGIFKLRNMKMGDAVEKLLVDGIKAGYDRLKKSIIKEIRSDLTEKAQQHAVGVFGHNLERLLLVPPLGHRKLLAIDPGIRTGCKFAVLGEYGDVLETGVFHTHKSEGAKAIISTLNKYEIDLVVIGNGTAGRETEELVASLIAEKKRTSNNDLWERVEHSIVSEAGASVYSVSDVAKEEFPELDCSLRGTISIGRRVQNPLAEMIKVPCPSMGIGLYQHDVPEKELSSKVDHVVLTCVNRVGVDINSASFSILEHISGLNKSKAKSIIAHREQNGNFTSRKQILKVKGIGPKTYEQCVGFIRIKDGKNYLDNTNIHPEVYSKVLELLETIHLDAERLCEGDYRKKKLDKALQSVDKHKVSKDLGIGLPTLELILENLAKPALDPRDSLPKPHFRKGVLSIQNLYEGQRLPAVARNVVDFGVFCDIGIKKDALLHISQIPQCAQRKQSIFDIIQVGDIIQVTISSIDKGRERVGLSMAPETNHHESHNKRKKYDEEVEENITKKKRHDKE